MTYRRIPSAKRFSRLAVVDSQQHARAAVLSDRNCIALVSAEGFQKWLRFFCPCGCGDLLGLNLMEGFRPRWKIRIDAKRRVSVWPSIRRLGGCKSHFFVTQNEIRYIYGRSARSGEWL